MQESFLERQQQLPPYERPKSGTKVPDFFAGIVPAVIGMILSETVLLSKDTLHSWQAYFLSAFRLLVPIRWRLHPAFVLALGPWWHFVPEVT
jgi:hypothetical protein